jgi:hypothetical protein
MAFSVIYIVPGLSPVDHAAAVATAPAFAESEKSYPALVAETGWTIRQRHDLTSAFMANCREKVRAEEAAASACSSDATFGASCSWWTRPTELRQVCVDRLSTFRR